MTQISVAFTGDVMLGRVVNEYINRYGPKYPWGDVLPIIKKADLSFINLECVITSHKQKSKMIKPFYFRADLKAIEVLKVADIDYVSLANNHSLDFQEKGLLECIELLDKSGIKHAGAGNNLKEASKPAILESKGVKFAVLSYADYPEEWKALETKGGINHTPITLDEKYFSQVRNSIKQARQQADFVIFSIHWGPNMRQYPTEEFIEFAHAVMDASVDIFHGHSAHVFQPIEIYKGKPIFYDCGDFIDDYAVDPELRNDYALLYFVVIDEGKKKIERIELLPCFIHSYKCQVNLAKEEIFQEIVNKVKELSKFFQTKVKLVKNKLVINL
ncbi:MAG: CapA family protein [Candidatus Aenigmatarchaeota archaeon]